METTAPRRVALYLRVSTARQAREDHSIPSQRKELTAFAKSRSWSVVCEYVDAGESAQSDDRPQFRQMLQDAKARPRPFDVLLVFALDRFARNRYDAAVNKRILRKLGISIVSFTQQFEDDAQGHLMEGVIESIDQYYSERLALTVRHALRQAASAGFWPHSRPPFGYRSIRIAVGTGERSKLEPDPQTAAIVRDLFERAGNGSTQQELVQWMNSTGVRTTRGHLWRQSTLSRVLRNEVYLGRLVFNQTSVSEHRGRKFHDRAEWVTIEDTHEPIITPEQFARVRHIMCADRPRWRGTVYLLSGIAVCKHCGSRLVVSNARYRCRSNVLFGKCVGKRIRTSEADAVLLREVARMRVDHAALKRHHVKRQDKDPLVERERRATDALRRQHANVVRAIEGGAEGLVDRFNELDGLLRRQALKLAAIENAVKEQPKTADAKAWMRDLTKRLSSGPTLELRAVLQRVVTRVVVDLEAKRLDVRTVLPLR